MLIFVLLFKPKFIADLKKKNHFLRLRNSYIIPESKLLALYPHS